uniref:Tectonic family member 2 n=1 Tax=Hippocampus comes TaxID=109280 RepID=A0A3Q2XT64_HIPCM
MSLSSVFQPSSIIATGPRITAFLLGNIKDVSLNVRTVFPSNNALRVNLQLNKSLHLCGDNETDCCPKPLCVLESLQVSACVGNTVQASLLIQAKIHAHLISAFPRTGNNQTVIPNQVYEPLGSCPCDLTARTCDIRCCCDKDCSPEELKLFQSHCHPGPFGGQRPPVPDYHCSARRDNSPDWFPFLCVISPPENNPYLGLFYNGDKIIPKPRPSFQIPVLSEPVFNIYRQGNPIFTLDDQLFTIPQVCLFLCSFYQNQSLVCDKVTLALDYTFYWKRNHITNGTALFSNQFVFAVKLTTRYSAVFLTRDYVGESNSGNPGYQVGKPVIAGIERTQNTAFSVQRTSINLWKPVHDGLCFTAEKQPVLFAMNSTSGCHLHVSLQNLTQCDLLRATVGSLQTNLITATYVAKKGNPNSEKEADWVKIRYMNSSTSLEDGDGSCGGIPSHIHISIWSLVTETTEETAQSNIQAIQVRYVYRSPNHAAYLLYSLFLRFQINFTEYDCNKNDVCWPHLAFPLTKYYTGEPHSQALAKGLILLFFFIAASLLGTPWRQIRQAWNSSSRAVIRDY